MLLHIVATVGTDGGEIKRSCSSCIGVNVKIHSYSIRRHVNSCCSSLVIVIVVVVVAVVVIILVEVLNISSK